MKTSQNPALHGFDYFQRYYNWYVNVSYDFKFSIIYFSFSLFCVYFWFGSNSISSSYILNWKSKNITFREFDNNAII